MIRVRCGKCGTVYRAGMDHKCAGGRKRSGSPKAPKKKRSGKDKSAARTVAKMQRGMPAS